MSARSDSGVRVFRARPTGPAQRDRGEVSSSIGVHGLRPEREESPALPPLRLVVTPSR